VPAGQIEKAWTDPPHGSRQRRALGGFEIAACRNTGLVRRSALERPFILARFRLFVKYRQIGKKAYDCKEAKTRRK
jgi:hypothetical protein